MQSIQKHKTKFEANQLRFADLTNSIIDWSINCEVPLLFLLEIFSIYRNHRALSPRIDILIE